MSGELHYEEHSRRRKVVWLVFYLALLGVFVWVLFWIAGHIRSRALPVGQIQLTVSNSKYAVGEPIIFTLTNKLNAPVYVTNRCPTEPLDVYRQESGRWIRQHSNADVSDCPDEKRQVIVPANGTITGSFAPWQQMFNTPGTYRLVAVVENYAGLTYQDFSVVQTNKQPQTQQQPSSTPTVTTPSLSQPQTTPSRPPREQNDD